MNLIEPLTHLTNKIPLKVFPDAVLLFSS